jgi:hypothetical protein
MPFDRKPKVRGKAYQAKPKAKKKRKFAKIPHSWIVLLRKCKIRPAATDIIDRNGDVTFINFDAGSTYRVTWPGGSPFTGYLNAGDFFEIPYGTDLTLTVDAGASGSSGNPVSYNFVLAKYDLLGNLKPCKGGGAGGGADVIVDA